MSKRTEAAEIEFNLAIPNKTLMRLLRKKRATRKRPVKVVVYGLIRCSCGEAHVVRHGSSRK
jgi:hypothetical protein